jgi:hypothetical protein
MATLSNFGEQFAAKTLTKVYAEAVFPAIVNRNYEGEIQKPGDRVNILSFLNNVLLSDYAVGSDMSSETIVDAEDVLVVEKRKYYNFSLDRLEDLFTYANDIPAVLLENSSYVLKNAIDTYILEKAAEAKAGNWIAFDLQVIGGAVTMASIVTTATGGTVTLVSQTDADTTTIGGVELIDGTVVHGGFEACDVGKGFRLRSTATYVSPWYKIASVTSSVSAALTEWDGAVSGSDFTEGFTLRGIYGGDGKYFPKTQPGDVSWMVAGTCANLGWEIQAAYPTAVSASSIYDQITLLAERLNAGDVPMDNRHLTVPEEIVTQLKQSSETQPSGISEIYTGTVINGRFMRMGGFDIHMATGARLSTRIGKALGNAASATNASSATGVLMLANTPAFVTFAEKWSESRIVDAENQFAKKYQGLFLYGCKVPAYSRKFGTVLYGNF